MLIDEKGTSGRMSESGSAASSNSQFSPISKPVTPKANQGKNLTGPARHVRDLAADIHACVQQWNTYHLQGFEILKSVTAEKQDGSYSPVLQELCDNLECICDKLDNVVQNLEQITHQLKVLATLYKNDKLFMMWPSTKFGCIAETIYTAYCKESDIKRKVLENVAHNHTESWKMLCLATWVHQPLLPSNLAELLESLLIETGHR